MAKTRVETVIVPIAGNGSRMRPATDAVAKELLPVYDTPLLKFGLDEAAAAGAKRVILVIRSSKPGLKRYIEHLVSEEGSDLQDMEVVFAEQPEPLGLGHAVLCAREQSLPGPIAVILPDDLILGASTLADMCSAFVPGEMKCLIAAEEVDPSQVGNYGIFDLRDVAPASAVMPARGLVEKPAPEDAPSNFAAVGRYVLDEAIWDVLERTPPGAGDEIQLTDAITTLGDLHAFRFSGQRYDCGSKEGWFAATEAHRNSRLANESLAAE